MLITDSEVTLAVTALGAVGALGGVWLGAALNGRTQRSAQAASDAAQSRALLAADQIQVRAIEADKQTRVSALCQTACIDLLAVVRQFRRFVMYSELTLKRVPGNTVSEGTIAFPERAEYDARVDTCFKRVLAVVESQEIRIRAEELARRASAFVRERELFGFGLIPDSVIADYRAFEFAFADLVRQVYGDRSDGPAPTA